MKPTLVSAHTEDQYGVAAPEFVTLASRGR